MISVCCVTFPHASQPSFNCLKPIEDIFIDSIVSKTKMVDEVILVKHDLPREYYEEKLINNISIKTLGSGITQKSSYGHALGLHYCIDKAKNDYVLLADIDIMLYTSVDEIFLNLMQKHDLFAVGISMNCPVVLASTFFPFVQFLLLKKSTLPGPNFLTNCKRIINLQAKDFDIKLSVPLDGKFLLPGPTKEHWEEFPNPQGSFDTSCNLWLWCHQHNLKWLSFQTMDMYTYNLNLYRTNFKLKDKLGNKKLLYHIISATQKMVDDPSMINTYKELWEKIKNES